MYSSPLSTLISPLSLNHHLYAHDTQLFFIFCPPSFDSSISHLQNAFQQISSWMIANLLIPPRLNLTHWTQKQLDNIHNSTLNTTHSARNLGFISDEHLTFSDQNFGHLQSLLLGYHIRQLRCIRSYLDSTIARTIATSIIRARQLYKNISMLFLFPVKRDLLFTNI